MREKYETLALKDLKALAKIRGIKGLTGMTKDQVIDAMVAKDEEEAAKTAAPAMEEAKPAKRPGRPKKTGAAKEESAPEKETVVKEETVKEEEPAAEEAKPQKRKYTRKADKAAAPETAPAEETASDNKPAETESKPLEKKDPVDQKPAEGENASVKAEEKPSTAEAGTAPQERRPFARKKVVFANGGQGDRKHYHSDNGDRTYQERKPYENPAEAEKVTETSTDKAQAAPSENAEKPVTGEGKEERPSDVVRPEKDYNESLDSGIPAHGILEIMPEGFGFIRCENFLPGNNDVYVAPATIRRFGLKTGDIIEGNTKIKTQNEKFSALLYIRTVNGYTLEEIAKRVNFEDMTPIFPNERISLETQGCTVAMRVMDLLSPVGKGQRGMIVSPPKAGKTTLLKEVAKSVKKNNPEIHMIILLIDERPEEVTDIKEAIEGPNVEVIYSTFDELPEHHKRVSEMVIERAKRLVESHKDVMILLDSITRLTRAYNLTVPPSGRTLSGGLDPAALHMPKRFFGAARNMREGGSLTILATALVETGSKMDDVVYEEFKGTGNMEMVLDRKLSEKRIFPAIDIAKSGTRRDDLLLTKEEIDAVNTLRKGINGLKPDESVDRILDMFSKTRSNSDFIRMVNKIHFF